MEQGYVIKNIVFGYNTMKWIVIALIIQIATSACANECGSCLLQSNPYSCTTCNQSTNLIYLSSCPTQNEQFKSFIAIAVIITILHLGMIGLGIGIYREIFQNIQLLSLITWRYGFERGTFALQGTNFAVVRNNVFTDMFGYQFIVVLALLLVFGLVMVTLGKTSQQPTAILLRRKRIIFPVRIMTLFYNILLFSSLAQLSTIGVAPINVLALILAICGVLFAISILVFIGVISNYRKFQVDDPHYYVLVEQMVTKRWFSKNNLLLNLITRTGIIISFVFLFKSPGVAGIIMLILQIGYTIYFVIFIRFIKIRYFMVLSINLLITIGVIFTIYIGASSEIGSATWKQSSLAYIILYSIVIFVFFAATTIQIALRKQQIVKQIKSMYRRFLKCEESSQENKIIISKYDQNGNRQKVRQFKKNLLYKQSSSKNRQLEMADIST